MLFKQMAHRTALLAVPAALFFVSLLSARSSGDAAAGPNLMASFNDTDNAQLVENPWGCVIDGVITLPSGEQLAVDESGAIKKTVFGPSCSVGDLNGDGLPDIVVADPRGYFWFFPNSGSSTKPQFTTCELMPIWIGAPIDKDGDVHMMEVPYDANDNTVPRIQLIDYAGDKKLSIVAGNYEGKLFYIHNVGSARAPGFTMPNDLSAIMVDTYSNSLLWCNFLAPFLYDFTGNGKLDLVMGEGTYASNSIYRLANRGSNGSPIFNDHFTTKIIPGYGREHLTPQVVDWNNDGKPDIIAGERQGYLDLWLNQSPDNDPAHLQFDALHPQHVKLGSAIRFGDLTTVAVCDLTGNKMPNLIVSNAERHLSYALNTGKPGAPQFGTPVPIQAVNPLPKIYEAPDNWSLTRNFDQPYLTLCSTSVKDDPDFKGPDDDPTIKSALKLYIVPHQHTYFPNEIYSPKDDTRLLNCSDTVVLEDSVHYDLTFWCKSTGTLEGLHYFFYGAEDLSRIHAKLPNGSVQRRPYVQGTFDAGSSWTQIKADVEVERVDPSKAENSPMKFHVVSGGNGGTLWLAGFSLTKSAR
jgi:hypothetical protein